MYELYNGGAVSVKYQIDTTPLDLMRAESYDHPIFEVKLNGQLALTIFQLLISEINQESSVRRRRSTQARGSLAFKPRIDVTRSLKTGLSMATTRTEVALSFVAANIYKCTCISGVESSRRDRTGLHCCRGMEILTSRSQNLYGEFFTAAYVVRREGNIFTGVSLSVQRRYPTPRFSSRSLVPFLVRGRYPSPGWGQPPPPEPG